MHNAIVNVGSATLLGKYPLEAANKVEHFGIMAVLLYWTLTGISGDLVTNAHCS